MKSLYPALATEPEIAFLCDTIRTLPPRARIVEVGVWEGGTTILAATAAKANDALSYWAVDHFAGSKDLPFVPGVKDRFLDNLHVNGLDGFVTVCPVTSLDAAALVESDSLDLVYIDASHEQKDVKADIAAWYPKVKKGGYLMGHDYDREHPGVVKAVNMFANGIDADRLDISEGKWRVWRFKC